MIDTSEPQEHHIARMCAMHSNNVEEITRRIEMSLLMGDEANVLALAVRLRAQAEKIADYAALSIAGEPGE